MKSTYDGSNDDGSFNPPNDSEIEPSNDMFWFQVYGPQTIMGATEGPTGPQGASGVAGPHGAAGSYWFSWKCSRY